MAKHCLRCFLQVIELGLGAQKHAASFKILRGEGSALLSEGVRSADDKRARMKPCGLGDEAQGGELAAEPFGVVDVEEEDDVGVALGRNDPGGWYQDAGRTRHR